MAEDEEVTRALLNKQRIGAALELAHSDGALRDRHVDAIIRTLDAPDTTELFGDGAAELWRERLEKARRWA